MSQIGLYGGGQSSSGAEMGTSVSPWAGHAFPCFSSAYVVSRGCGLVPET